MLSNPFDPTDVWIITLNWNKPDITKDCLHSLMINTGTTFSFLLIDNGSNDDSVKILKNEFPSLITIYNKENLGFGAGFNIGIKYAIEQGAKYILIINNDTIADPTMMNQLLSVIEGDDEIGIVAPFIYFYENKEKIWSQGGYINSFLLEKTESKSKNHSKDQNMKTFLTACCLLINIEVFKKVGVFDERFFMYYEDLDFSLRCLKNGIIMKIVPEAKLWHRISTSSGGKNNPLERFYMAKSSGLFFRKHMKIWQSPFIVSYRLGSAILCTYRLLRNRQYNSIPYYWRGLIQGWVKN